MKSYHVHTQMFSISPDLLELDSDLIECLSDNGNEDILHLQYHPIRGQYLCHVICIVQSQVSISVTWLEGCCPKKYVLLWNI